LELPDLVVAAQLGHDYGGTLVRELYEHPEAAIARERIHAAFRAAPSHPRTCPATPRRVTSITRHWIATLRSATLRKPSTAAIR